MFRTISLLKRKADLTPQQFRHHYETIHRCLREKALAGIALTYERYYLYAMSPGGAPPIYDSMTQICFPSRDAYDRCNSDASKSALAKMISADEDLFIERETSVHFEAQDCSSKLQTLAPSENIFRTIWFAQRRPGMTHEQSRHYYENKHRLLGEYIMNGYAAGYDRHYLYRLEPDFPEPYYTFVTEINFPSRNRYEDMAATITGDSTLTQFLAEDEERFINRSVAVHYTAEAATSGL